MYRWKLHTSSKSFEVKRKLVQGFEITEISSIRRTHVIVLEPNSTESSYSDNRFENFNQSDIIDSVWDRMWIGYIRPLGAELSSHPITIDWTILFDLKFDDRRSATLWRSLITSDVYNVCMFRHLRCRTEGFFMVRNSSGDLFRFGKKQSASWFSPLCILFTLIIVKRA